MATNSNKVQFGLSNCHYAIATEGTNGAITFGEWKDLPFAINLNRGENSNTSNQYADNKLIFTATAVASETLALEMSKISDDFKIDVLGYKRATNGNLVKIVNGIKKKFALGFEVKGDVKKARHIFFLCEANSIDDGDPSTDTDSINFSNDTINMTAYPITLASGDYAIKERVDEEDSNYATIFTNALTLPTFSA